MNARCHPVRLSRAAVIVLNTNLNKAPDAEGNLVRVCLACAADADIGTPLGRHSTPFFQF